MDFEKMRVRCQIEDEQDWRGEIERIPFIAFPEGWQVQVIPPFADAVVRFRVKLPSGTIKSVYLDARCSLGFYKDFVPYWEVYPFDSDPGRCEMNDVDELLRMIAFETKED